MTDPRFKPDPRFTPDDGEHAPAVEQPGAGAAFARGAGQGASLGFGDEMAGFGAWLAGGGKDNVPRAAGRGTDAPLSGATDYDVARNAERDANAQAQAAHPYAYGGGQLAGGIAPAIVTGAALAPATAGLGATGTAALEGAALGGASGTGSSDASTAGGVARDALKGAAIGGATAGGLTAAAPYAGRALAAVGGKLKGGADTLGEVATEQRLAGAGVERAGMKKLRGRDGGLERYAEGADRLGIGKQGILPADVRTHAEDARAAAEAAGQAKDAIVAKLEGAGTTVHGADVGAAIRKLKSEHGASVGKHLEEIAGEFDSMGDVPWSQMNLERKDWGAQTNFDSGSVRAKLGKKIYGRINEAMADAAEKVDPGAGVAWRAANEDEHIALKLAEMGENKLNQGGNRAVSPTDYMAGAAGAVAAGPAGGVAGIIGNKVLRSREHAIASSLASKGETALNALGSGAERAGSALQSAAATPAARVGAESAGQAVAQRANSAVDRALGDPTYGPMLSAHPPGEQRDIVYSTLMIQDPKFRERERARAQNQQQEEQD